MEGFLPITKSFESDVALCPYKAARHKIDGVKSISGPAARRGNKAHKHMAAIRVRQTPLDEIMRTIEEDPEEEDRQEVKDLVAAAVAKDPIQLTEMERKTLQIEKYFAVNSQGKLVRKPQAIVSGFIDRLWVRSDGTLCIDDLKTGWMESTSPSERYYYVLGGKAMVPEATRVQFALFFCRSGNYPTWTFEFSDAKNNHQIIETGPDGKKTTHKFTKNPLIVYAENSIARIEKMERRANPGPHCQSWYGVPCQFLGNECPAAQDVPAAVDAIITPPNEKLSSMDLLRGIQSGEVPLTPELAGWAYAGVMQMGGFLEEVEKQIKKWSKAKGQFAVGDSTYGWFTKKKNVVDVEFALGEMLRSDMPIDEIAKVISIGASNIDKRISKRRYPQLREMLLDMAVTEEDGPPAFGEIKAVTEGEERAEV